MAFADRYEQIEPPLRWLTERRRDGPWFVAHRPLLRRIAGGLLDRHWPLGALREFARDSSGTLTHEGAKELLPWFLASLALSDADANRAALDRYRAHADPRVASLAERIAGSGLRGASPRWGID